MAGAATDIAPVREILDKVHAEGRDALTAPEGNQSVLLSDACVEEGLSLMDIPPFGAAGNPIDITGGEPPSTYEETILLGLEVGFWHTIVTPPMGFAEVTSRVVEEHRAKGIDKPVVSSLAGDTKYRWARAGGLLDG